MPITQFRAFWNPGNNLFGIQVRVNNGPFVTLPINTPEEFIAVLTVLNGPSPTMGPQGQVECHN